MPPLFISTLLFHSVVIHTFIRSIDKPLTKFVTENKKDKRMKRKEKKRKALGPELQVIC